MLPFPIIDLTALRVWLRPAGAGPDELARGVVVAGHVRWLRARLRGPRVEFAEIVPATTKTWQPASPAAVAQVERALRAEIGR
jgi:hypothetical protein